jgi:hypothetical protein
MAVVILQPPTFRAFSGFLGRMPSGSRKGWRKLTEGVPFTLEGLKCGCVSFPRFCYFLQSPISWEVVQLVGLQTLDSANAHSSIVFAIIYL